MKKLITIALLALVVSCAPANDKNTGTQTESTATQTAATKAPEPPPVVAKAAEEEKPMSYYEN